MREWLALFPLTHQLTPIGARAVWQLRQLPVSGGVEAQSAKVMEALAVIAREQNALLQATQE